MLNSLKYSRD